MGGKHGGKAVPVMAMLDIKVNQRVEDWRQLHQPITPEGDLHP